MGSTAAPARRVGQAGRVGRRRVSGRTVRRGWSRRFHRDSARPGANTRSHRRLGILASSWTAKNRSRQSSRSRFPLRVATSTVSRASGAVDEGVGQHDGDVVGAGQEQLGGHDGTAVVRGWASPGGNSGPGGCGGSGSGSEKNTSASLSAGSRSSGRSVWPIGAARAGMTAFDQVAMPAQHRVRTDRCLLSAGYGKGELEAATGFACGF